MRAPGACAKASRRATGAGIGRCPIRTERATRSRACNLSPMTAGEHNGTGGRVSGPRDGSRYAASLRLSVAPMMDWTDSHCRVFHRLLAPNARLYTEMVHANAVIHGDRAKLLAMDPVEHPVALQLGGSEPALLARSARIGADHGFDEINLNVGCPSDRVQAGRFGACLMREPALVADSVAAMIAACDVPVTVKCRLGVDDDHDYARFLAFVDTVAAAGCRKIGRASCRERV